MASLRKIQRREAFRNRIFFGFDDNLKQPAKQTGALWSRIHRSWYLSYDAEKTRMIRNEFPDHVVLKDSGNQASTPAPGLKNSHDTAPIVVKPQANNALPLPGAGEHNPPELVYKIRKPVYIRRILSDMTGKGEYIRSCKQLKISAINQKFSN